ncbi:MAG: Fe-S cluster assembly protein SufB [bacterium]
MKKRQNNNPNALELLTADQKTVSNINQDYKTKFGFADEFSNKIDLGTGIDQKIVREISELKHEDNWMLQKRLKAFQHFCEAPLPKWGADLSHIDFQKIHYYVKAASDQSKTWNEVPDTIKNTFEKLGIPQAERKFLAGVATQYESEVIYQNLKKKWTDQGIIFLDTDSAYKQYPEIFQEYFGKIIPETDNKFAALNTAVWSGGTFIYIPKGVKLKMPLQAYFRINTQNMGQFERTLIIADEDSEIHYIEGCTAPMYSNDSLHSAVVEIVVKKNARVRYTTLQNWSTNVYNLVTKRALVHENAVMEWVDCNLGSKVTMKYPAAILVGPGAHGEILSIALAGKGQHLDAGAKVIHLAPNTSSIIHSKSICHDGGRSSYRGLLKIIPGATNSKSKIVCDALILDDRSRTDTYPTNDIREKNVETAHEASVSKINEEQIFYLMSRGLTEEQANALIVSGFIEPIVKELPLEYAMELNALINLTMEGSIG